MVTITLSLPEEFEKVRKRFPEVNWNEVVKGGVLKRLDELKRLEKSKERI